MSEHHEARAALPGLGKDQAGQAPRLSLKALPFPGLGNGEGQPMKELKYKLYLPPGYGQDASACYPVLYLLGLAQIAVYFVVFTVLIKALDLPTPGRRPEEPVRPEAALLDDAGVEKLIAALGGRENICTVDNCFTRLRVTVQDAAFVREQALRELPCSGVVQNGCNVQIVFGIRAPQVRQAVEQRLDRVVC